MEIDVTIDDAKTSLRIGQEVIAKGRHDTETIKIADEVNNELTACCKCERSVLKFPMKPTKYKYK